MTEQEEMLNFLQNMTQAAKENRQKQADEAAKCLHDMYTSYLQAGFTPKQAMELLKTSLELGLRIEKK